MQVTPASHSLRRPSASLGRTHLRRFALATAAIFFLLTISVGALHRHGSPSSLDRIDCQACAWVHAAAGALSHAAPAITAFATHLAPHTPSAGSPSTRVASPHRGRAPPSSLV